VNGPEDQTTRINEEPVAGRAWTEVRNVLSPTLTVYAAKNNPTGAAIVVFPGGGYHVLAIDLEGTEACEFLTARGVTCVLLKYRVPGETGREDDYARPEWGPYQESTIALSDAQRAMGLVRKQAAAWGIDPHRLGVMGFSAGGHLVASLSTHHERRSYPRVDDADDQSCRPDFGVVLYPGHLARAATPDDLNPSIRVTGATPPTFIVQAEDDPVDPVANSLAYYRAFVRARVPAELHIYHSGKHAFGLRARADLPITGWPDLMMTWLEAMGVSRRARP
jgi:acetyl esterase/lipase